MLGTLTLYRTTTWLRGSMSSSIGLTLNHDRHEYSASPGELATYWGAVVSSTYSSNNSARMRVLMVPSFFKASEPEHGLPSIAAISTFMGDTTKSTCAHAGRTNARIPPHTAMAR